MKKSRQKAVYIGTHFFYLSIIVGWLLFSNEIITSLFTIGILILFTIAWWIFHRMPIFRKEPKLQIKGNSLTGVFLCSNNLGGWKHPLEKIFQKVELNHGILKKVGSLSVEFTVKSTRRKETILIKFEKKPEINKQGRLLLNNGKWLEGSDPQLRLILSFITNCLEMEMEKH